MLWQAANPFLNGRLRRLVIPPPFCNRGLRFSDSSCDRAREEQQGNDGLSGARSPHLGGFPSGCCACLFNVILCAHRRWWPGRTLRAWWQVAECLNVGSLIRSWVCGLILGGKLHRSRSVAVNWMVRLCPMPGCLCGDGARFSESAQELHVLVIHLACWRNLTCWPGNPEDAGWIVLCEMSPSSRLLTCKSRAYLCA